MGAPPAIRIVHTFHAACTALSCHRRRETFQHPRMNKSYAYCWKCLNLNSREADLSLAKHYETLQKDFVVAVNSGPQSWHLKYQVSAASLWSTWYLNECIFEVLLHFKATFPIHSPVWTSKTFPTRPVSSCLKNEWTPRSHFNCHHTSLHTVQPLPALHRFHRLGPPEAEREEKILEVETHPQLCR